MNLVEFQKLARQTAVYPNIGKNYLYPLVGLCGESGELANVIKKAIRDDNYIITGERKFQVLDELGDLMWYIVMLCYELDIDPDFVLTWNNSKLQKRKKTNTIHDKGRKEKK